MSKRFVVQNIKIDGEILSISGEEVHHINVLRYKIGDKIYVGDYEVEVTLLTKDILEGKIIGKMQVRGIPSNNITLIQSYLKADKMEFVVQKAVELGAKKILPVTSKNTVVKIDDKDKEKKLSRLSKIAKEAIEQCGRTDTVEVAQIVQLFNVDFSSYDTVLFCYEESKNSLKDVICSIKTNENIAIVIGPEGGWDKEEVKKLMMLPNMHEVSLGERILRAETASVALLSILWYELG